MQINSALQQPVKRSWYKPSHPRRFAALAAVLGTSVAAPFIAPEATHNAVLKVSSLLPGTADASRIYVTCSDSPEISNAENNYAQANLKVYQNIDKYSNNILNYLNASFPDSPSAKVLGESFLSRNSEQIKAINNTRIGLGTFGIAPDSILNSNVNYDDPLQVQIRDTFLKYCEGVEPLVWKCINFTGFIERPARLQFANSTHETLKYWEENFDDLFKPLSESEEDIKAYEERKKLFLDSMEKIHNASEIFAKYEAITPEQMLDESVFKNPRKITIEEVQEFIRIIYDKEVKTETVENWMHLLKTSPMLAEAMIPAPIFELLKADPRIVASDFYSTLVLSASRSIGDTPQFQQVFNQKPALLEQIKTERENYRNLVNPEYWRLGKDAYNAQDQFTKTIANGTLDLSRYYYQGRWVNNPFNFTQKESSDYFVVYDGLLYGNLRGTRPRPIEMN